MFVYFSLLNNYLDYKTNYFKSFSKFVDRFKFNYNMFLSIVFCNIKSIKAHFDKLIMHINSENNLFVLDIIVLT